MNASRESRSLNSRTTASPVCRMFRVRLPATTRAKLKNRGKMKRCPTQYAFNRVLLQSLHDRQVDTSTLLPPLLLFLLPSNSTLVNFFSPSPHGNGTSPATDRSETTDNYTLLFEPCFEKFEKDRSEGRKGGRESRFNCFTDGRKKLPSSSSSSSSSLCPFERRLEHERSSSRQSFGAANIGHSVVFCARREHHRWGIPSRV